MIELNLEPTLENKLLAVASESGKPMDALISQAVIALLEDMEDAALVDASLAEEGDEWTMDQVKQDLGLE